VGLLGARLASITRVGLEWHRATPLGWSLVDFDWQSEPESDSCPYLSSGLIRVWAIWDTRITPVPKGLFSSFWTIPGGHLGSIKLVDEIRFGGLPKWWPWVVLEWGSGLQPTSWASRKLAISAEIGENRG